MNIALHGAAYIAAVFCALWGAANILAGIHEWAEDRVTRDGWRLRLRWDRPGTEVLLPDGREGAIQVVYRGEDAGLMAVVIFEDAGPEWAPVSSLSPAPAEVQEQAA